MNTKARPLAALFGVGAFVLGIAGTLAYPSSPEFVDEPAKIADFYLNNDDKLLAADTLYLLAGVLLLAFAGYLWSASRHAEGGDGRIAGTAFGGAIAGSALLLAGPAIDAVAALRVGEQNEIDPQVATVMWDLQSILFGLAAPMAFAVLVLATAVLALRKGLLPSWHGAISVVLGIAMLIPPINYIAIIAFEFWVLLTGLMLYLHPQPAESRSANTVV